MPRSAASFASSPVGSTGARLSAGAPELAATRIDIWLWSVRIVKSRTQATAACRAGHVKLNGANAKASQKVQVGDEIRIRIAGLDRILRITRVIGKRVGAPLATRCYEDHSPPRPTGIFAPAPIVRPKGAGRPTKKERRQLESWRRQQDAL